MSKTSRKRPDDSVAAKIGEARSLGRHKGARFAAEAVLQCELRIDRLIETKASEEALREEYRSLGRWASVTAELWAACVETQDDHFPLFLAAAEYTRLAAEVAYVLGFPNKAKKLRADARGFEQRFERFFATASYRAQRMAIGARLIYQMKIGEVNQIRPRVGGRLDSVETVDLAKFRRNLNCQRNVLGGIAALAGGRPFRVGEMVAGVDDKSMEEELLDILNEYAFGASRKEKVSIAGLNEWLADVPDGTLSILQWTKDGGGHMVLAYKYEGWPMIVDPQSNEAYVLDEDTKLSPDWNYSITDIIDLRRDELVVDIVELARETHRILDASTFGKEGPELLRARLQHSVPRAFTRSLQRLQSDEYRSIPRIAVALERADRVIAGSPTKGNFVSEIPKIMMKLNFPPWSMRPDSSRNPHVAPYGLYSEDAFLVSVGGRPTLATLVNGRPVSIDVQTRQIRAGIPVDNYKVVPISIISPAQIDAVFPLNTQSVAAVRSTVPALV